MTKMMTVGRILVTRLKQSGVDVDDFARMLFFVVSVSA